MFGEPEPSLSNLKQQYKTQLKDLDFSMPDASGRYAHRARQPNTDHLARQLHAIQSERSRRIAEEQKDLSVTKNILMHIEYEERTDRLYLRDRIKTKVNEKIQNYIASIDKRRDKLKNLLAEEEEQYVYETVNNALKANESRVEEMMRRSKELKAAKEAERIEIVKQKRLQQYSLRCLELRPYLSRKLTEESKICQLQQMRENEARRQSEKEIARMWDNLVIKQDEAFMEREVQEALIKYNRCRKDMDVLTMQIRAKKTMVKVNEEMDRANAQEYKKIMELQNQQQREEMQRKFNKRRQDAEDLRQQIAIHKQFADQRKKEEMALDNAFAKLAQLELQQEKEGHVDNRGRLRKEMETYKHHLEHLKQQRREEDLELEKVIDEYRQVAQRKSEEATCKHVLGRRKLQEKVLEERAAQVEYNRKKAEKELEFKKTENAMMRDIFEMNKGLHEEARRIQKMVVKNYRDDLGKQIEYNYLLKKREMEEAERRLQQGLEEERRLDEIVQEIIKANVASTIEHPFRRIINQYNCQCNPDNEV